jgi:hypothetical protein
VWAVIGESRNHRCLASILVQDSVNVDCLQRLHLLNCVLYKVVLQKVSPEPWTNDAPFGILQASASEMPCSNVLRLTHVQFGLKMCCLCAGSEVAEPTPLPGSDGSCCFTSYTTSCWCVYTSICQMRPPWRECARGGTRPVLSVLRRKRDLFIPLYILTHFCKPVR